LLVIFERMTEAADVIVLLLEPQLLKV